MCVVYSSDGFLVYFCQLSLFIMMHCVTFPGLLNFITRLRHLFFLYLTNSAFSAFLSVFVIQICVSQFVSLLGVTLSSLFNFISRLIVYSFSFTNSTFSPFLSVFVIQMRVFQFTSLRVCQRNPVPVFFIHPASHSYLTTPEIIPQF